VYRKNVVMVTLTTIMSPIHLHAFLSVGNFMVVVCVCLVPMKWSVIAESLRNTDLGGISDIIVRSPF
jgi:hypothetical protein